MKSSLSSEVLILTSVFLVLISCVSLVYSQSTTPYRLVNAKFNPGKETKVYIVCPDVRSGEEVELYKNNELYAKDPKGFGIVVSVKTNSDLGDYMCEVKKNGKVQRQAKITLTNNMVLENLKYNSDETVQYNAKLGDSIKMKCKAKKQGKYYWVKNPQFVIAEGETLEIKSINQYDYGSYYCYSSQPGFLNAEGVKYNLLPIGRNRKKQSIDHHANRLESYTPKSSVIRYRSSIISKREDQITWEQPPGNILLNHGRDFYVSKYDAKKHSVTPLYYQITRNGDPNVRISTKFILSVPKQDVKISFDNNVKFGEKLKLICGFKKDLKSGEKIVWKKDNDVIGNNSNNLLIEKFTKRSFGNYSCNKMYGSSVVSSDMVVLKQKILKTKDVIEMTKIPGLVFQVHTDQTQELHCELPRIDGVRFRSNQVIWTFNGEKIMSGGSSKYGNTDRFARMDSPTASVLVLKNIDIDNEGVYKCYADKRILAVNLVVEQQPPKFMISPRNDRVQHNKGQRVGFHCRIDYPKTVNNTHIKWSFIPGGNSKGKEQPLLSDVITTNPTATSSTSFITINNGMKKHEGFYVCRVLNQKAVAFLQVTKTSKIMVTPKQITIKPGGSAGFTCKIDDIEGNINWRRKDRKPFNPQKEIVLGGRTNRMLQIKNAPKSFDGTEYECYNDYQTETVKLFVREDCPLNQRKCKSGKCIDEKRFCDKINDCGDNSDEDETRCTECNPNSIHCDFINGTRDPTRRCVIAHWKCDGVDDCGNNFDEMNCETKNKDICIGSHYKCNNTLIPRAYWCDGESDCTDAVDEIGCSSPTVLHPKQQRRYVIYEGKTVVIKCIVSGRPIPTISWRYNWGYLPRDANKTITNEVTNCSVVTSTLTINNITNDMSGIYTCEAISNKRVIPPDFVVTVQPPSVCKKPNFNNDAAFDVSCLRCFCSNMTDDCTSAMGYKKSEKPIVYPHNSSLAVYDLNNNMLKKEFASEKFTDSNGKQYVINEAQLQNMTDRSLFIGGDFGVNDLWTQRYGYVMKYELNVTISTNSPSTIYGPLLAIKANGSDTIYYCPPRYATTVFPTTPKNPTTNEIKVSLSERSSWYTNIYCGYPTSRTEFMKVITTPNKLLFRVNYFAKDQTKVIIKNIQFDHAVESKNDQNSWVGKLEKCNCPAGRTGLSCETAE